MREEPFCFFTKTYEKRNESLHQSKDPKRNNSSGSLNNSLISRLGKSITNRMKYTNKENLLDSGLEENVSQEDNEVKESEEYLCFKMNKHVYSFLFTALRSDPCLLFRLFALRAMPDCRFPMNIKSQVEFTLELFPPVFDRLPSLVFYSKLVKLSLEHHFTRKKEDFLSFFTDINFSAEGINNFLDSFYEAKSRHLFSCFGF